MVMRICAIASIALLWALQPAAARDIETERLTRMMAGGPMLDPPELAAAIAEAEKHPLGSSQNPVRAARPTGQRAYLATLRCADGKAPGYARAGNAGLGIYSSVVDRYIVDCGAAAPGKVEVIMDMYHPGHVETRPVPGFTIALPGGTATTI